jgi:hypothetical protein
MPSRSLRLPAQTLRNSQKHNTRNIKHMAVFIFSKFLDFEQVSADSEIPILEQASSKPVISQAQFLALTGNMKSYI